MYPKKAILLFLSLLFTGVCIFPQEPDTLLATADSTNHTGGTDQKNERIEGITYVSNIRLFIDSIKNSVPDTMLYYDWITNDIHIRKFDFEEIEDTFHIVLDDTLHKYTHPFKGRATSGFGARRWRYHYGMDIDLNTGDTVYSAFDGVVRISTRSRTYGNVVVVRHRNGLETIYAHLSKRCVDIDSVIYSGDVVGLGGNTGRSYGSHLHFEIRFFDEALDPRDVIDFENYQLLNDTLSLSACNFEYREHIKDLSRIKFHVIQSGNTLSHLAKWYGTNVSTICRLNGISRNKVLQIGERIRVR